MDLGLFRRKKTMFWLWIVLPLVAIAGIHYSVSTYCRHLAEEVQTRRALALRLPDLDSALSLSKLEIGKFSQISGTAAEVQASINTRISAVSAECGLIVNSLRITSESTKDSLQRLEVSMDGEGQLLAVMKFMNKLQRPELLISLVNTKLRITKFEPKVVFNYLFEFEIGFVPLATEGQS